MNSLKQKHLRRSPIPFCSIKCAGFEAGQKLLPFQQMNNFRNIVHDIFSVKEACK